MPQGFEGLLGGATYTSYVNNQTLGAAWNVEFDVPVIGAGTPEGGAIVRVWGISLAEIGQANDLNRKNITVEAGMQRGLPLATPSQSGVIFQGYIFQAFGNWIGTDMTLDLVIFPGSASGTTPGGTGTLANPKNLVLNWQTGTTLATALASTLSTAFPGVPQSINIDPKLVRPNVEAAYFSTLEQLAKYCADISKDIIRTEDYLGVDIALVAGRLIVSDGTESAGAAEPKQIRIQDLIGQPTWIESPKISIKTVMRADLGLFDKILLPPTLVQNTPQANSWLVNQRTSFKGGFRITSMRHIGNFRQASADSWVTVIEAVPIKIVTQTAN